MRAFTPFLKSMSLDKNTRKHIALIVGAAAVVTGASTVLAYASHFEKTAQHMSILRGQQWVDELLEGHPARFKNEMGMSKLVFNRLLEVLEEDGGLKDSWYVSSQEQLAISSTLRTGCYLIVACKNASSTVRIQSQSEP